MVFFLLLLLLIINNGIVFSGSDKFNEEYISKKSTTAINGIFVILVVFSHYAQYAGFDGVYDEPYLALREHLNQMVVATFMFYTGFGMMESIHNKGTRYIKKIPVKFWQLLFKFDVAVILYAFLGGVVLGKGYTAKQVLLALTSWTNVGNSNWYITAILMIYIAMFLSFLVGYRCPEKMRDAAGIVLTIVLTIGWIHFQMKMDRPAYCYNTMILAPLGMLYSKNRHLVEKAVMRSDISYFLIVVVVLGIYIPSYFHRWDLGIEGYTVWAVAFLSLLLLFTMKVRVYNELLEWFGKHVFSIYILQRIPMSILDHFGCIESHKYFSLVVAFAVTILLALIFEKITDALINGIMKVRRIK